MATSTLLQKLDGNALISNITGSPGSYTTVQVPDVSNRRQVETFIAGGTVAAGDWVQFDTSATGASRVLTVIEATGATATGNPLVCGVCIGSAETDGSLTVGSKVFVVVGGYVEGANVDNAVAAAGVALVVDNTGAGIANAYAAADTAPICGVSLEAAAGGKCDVWVIKQF
jgi:hypothetical protein